MKRSLGLAAATTPIPDAQVWQRVDGLLAEAFDVRAGGDSTAPLHADLSATP